MKNKKRIFIITGAIVIVLAIALGIFIFLNNQKKNSDDTDDIMKAAGNPSGAVRIDMDSTSYTVNKMSPIVISVKNAVLPNSPRNITWKSSDEKIAIVHPLSFNPTANPNAPQIRGVQHHYALLVGVGKGKVTITATSEQGAKATTTVTVNAPNDIQAENVEVTLNPSASVLVGHTIKLERGIKANVDVDINSLTWKSSNTGIATVDSNGNVKGISPGTVTITLTVKGGSKIVTATSTITVNKGTIISNKNPVNCKVNERVTITMSGTSKVKDYLPQNDNIAGILRNDDTHFTVVCKKKGSSTIHFSSPELGYLILPVNVK